MKEKKTQEKSKYMLCVEQKMTLLADVRVKKKWLLLLILKLSLVGPEAGGRVWHLS
jgi:hypothetical protein